MNWLSPEHAVQYVLQYFSGIQIVKALVEVLGKDMVLKIIREEVK